MHRLATRHTQTNRSILTRLRYRTLRCNSSLAIDDADDNAEVRADIRRLLHFRNVGILAHVDAGKTTVTERMLALAGVVHQAGSVDEGNTVTDYLPAERERGITIQSAAISFEWGWHNQEKGDDYEANDKVQIHLIDTPGHVDFSVEVNRSVAVLDGAVLVVDAVAGVQAQTETVWRAMTRPSLNNHDSSATATRHMSQQDHAHEPLPCLALINKMDKEGCHFGNAIASLKRKLPGANPIPMQVPLFRVFDKSSSGSQLVGSNIVAVPAHTETMVIGDFVGVVDLVHMRAIIYPDVSSFNVDDCIPDVINLLCSNTHKQIDTNCHVTKAAVDARQSLIERLADIDEAMGEYFLLEHQPSNAEVRAALRRTTLARTALPVMAGAALRGRGVEPLLDSIADLLPSPLDRLPPALTKLDTSMWTDGKRKKKSNKETANESKKELKRKVTFGHPLHPTLLALAFKVVHMKGRGGSGDGRVVFARVYSGELQAGDTLQIVTPPAPGEAAAKPRCERIGGMLELAGGQFNNLEDGICQSGDVCALIGLKSVVTGDTIMLEPKGKGYNKRAAPSEPVCLAGVSSPKPVLKVRLEAESADQQTKLSAALLLLAIEDPSLMVEENDSTTLLSGLGELHIEVTLDRLQREHGLDVTVGKPAVSYRESLSASLLETDGLVNYDRTFGATRMQAAVHLRLESIQHCWETSQSSCVLLSDPVVTLGSEARAFLKADLDDDEDELMERNGLVRALILGCQGALKRGPLGSYAMSNMSCHIVNVHAEGGLSYLESMPGALRAGAANAMAGLFSANKHSCSLLEPTMSIEVIVPSSMVGMVLSDLTGRRGHVSDVHIGDGDELSSKALIRGEVPLVEILGYANSLRSLTAGEGAFTAEYKGHSPCDDPSMMSR